MEFELTTKQKYTVGNPIVVEAPSFNLKYVTVFEDDGDTGYFYALDMANQEMPIVDAMHMFNVKMLQIEIFHRIFKLHGQRIVQYLFYL